MTVGNQPSAIAAGFGHLWVANRGDNTVTRLDPGNPGKDQLTVDVGDAPAGIAVDDRTVWVTEQR